MEQTGSHASLTKKEQLILSREKDKLERTLGGNVERRQHLLRGDGACSYAVRFARNGEQDVTVEEPE